jgi:hypothetical protein
MELNYKLFEEKYKVAIPEQYKVITNYLELRNLLIEYYDETQDFRFRVTKWLYFKSKSSELMIDDFFSSTDLLKVWERHVELWGTPVSYLPIGTLSAPANGLLLISLMDESYGQICYTKQGERNPEFVEKDLINLLSNLKPEYRDDKKELLVKLYKNWGEDFWRIKT